MKERGSEKKALIWFIGGLAIVLIILITIFAYFLNEEQKRSDQNIVVDDATNYEPLNQPILLDKEQPDAYISLYNTGDYTLDLDAFKQICETSFIGLKKASDSLILDEIISVRNLLRSSKFTEAIDEIVTFGNTYSLTDSAESFELASICQFSYLIKDLSTLEKNSQNNAVRDILNSIKDPELYLLGTMFLESNYKYYLNLESICLNSVVGIDGCGKVLPDTDSHYTMATTYLEDVPLAIYQFTLQYNESIRLNAYIVTDAQGINHVLSIENEDGTFTSPKELETGFNNDAYEITEWEVVEDDELTEENASTESSADDSTTFFEDSESNTKNTESSEE